MIYVLASLLTLIYVGIGVFVALWAFSRLFVETKNPTLSMLGFLFSLSVMLTSPWLFIVVTGR